VADSHSKYVQYKAQVARIMGANPETFSEKDLKVCNIYLAFSL